MIQKKKTKREKRKRKEGKTGTIQGTGTHRTSYITALCGSVWLYTAITGISGYRGL